MPHPQINDGWTSAAQAAFLVELAASGVVARAAAAAGLSASSAYRFRRRPAGAKFDRAWTAAKAALYEHMLEVALERVSEGVVTDIVYRGAVTGTRTVISERLLMSMLAHLKPDAAAVRADPVAAFHDALDAVVARPAPTEAAPVPAPAPKPPVSAEVGRLIDAAFAATRDDDKPVVAVNRREPIRARALGGTIAAVGYRSVRTDLAGVNGCEPARALAAAGA